MPDVGPGWAYLRGVGSSAAGAVEGLLALPHVTDVVPSYDSVFVETSSYVGLTELERAVESASAATAEPNRTVTLRAVYGGAAGPDAELIARAAGLSVAELALLHAGASYTVGAVGFSPGFPFLSGLPPRLAAPRLPAPRAAVPHSSIGIAGHQTGVYPVASPGGWNLVGRVLDLVYDPSREGPFLLGVGDRVRFVDVTDSAAPNLAASDLPGPRAVSLLPPSPLAPVLRVVQPGLLDLVVDAGRPRVGRFGLSRSGPVDAPAARTANALLGQPFGTALLEMNLTGPVLEVLADCVVAVTGPCLSPRLDGAEMPAWSSFKVRAGQVLTFVPQGRGARSYLALSGGIDTTPRLGSSSVDIRGLLGAPLAEGVVIGAGTRGAQAGKVATGRSEPRPAVPGRRFHPHRATPSRNEPLRIKVVPGPQFDREAAAALTAEPFEVGRADRVGVRLVGQSVPGGEVASEGVPLGAVQVPPGGDPIVLLNDRGSLGGYAKPLVVHPDDLWRVGQARQGDRIAFVPWRP